MRIRPAGARQLSVVAAAVVAAGAVTVGTLSRHPGRTPPTPASTLALNTRVCLIGVGTNADVSGTWQSLLDAAARDGHVNAQKTVITASQASSAISVQGYIASLRQERCALVVAVGNTFHDTVQDDVNTYPDSHYVYLGSVPVQGGNVTNLPTGGGRQLAQTMTDAVAAARHA